MASEGPPQAIELRKLQSTYNEIERICTLALSSECARWGIPELEVRGEMLAKIWNGFHDLQQQVKDKYGQLDGIIALCDSTCEEAIYYYASAKASVQQHIKDLIAAQTPRPLPKVSEIKFGKFDGDFRNWTAWKAQFLAKVYDTGSIRKSICWPGPSLMLLLNGPRFCRIRARLGSVTQALR